MCRCARPSPTCGACRFPDGRFDTVVCLLTEQDVHASLAEMRRVLRPAGLLLLSTRSYDEPLRDRPASQRTVTFQLWHWHETASTTTWSTSHCCRPAETAASSCVGPTTGRWAVVCDHDDRPRHALTDEEGQAGCRALPTPASLTRHAFRQAG
ncbi:methyltransferase domain-containing protein [Streptomyces sp. NPDC051133]|uniref:class I SAM-dependent methyltransferase n=1 Tax=Streptomyces sp. NPDC051133 TaxID=3155521 RepID=UPI00341DAED7